jgi:hypothetical protein
MATELVNRKVSLIVTGAAAGALAPIPLDQRVHHSP